MRVLQFIRDVLATALIAFTIVLGMVMVLSLVGSAFEAIGDWQIEHERCLKKATNGYDIARCR